MEFMLKHSKVIENVFGPVPILLKALLDVELSPPDVLPQGGLTGESKHVYVRRR
jgi:hypothetical protein